MNGVLKRFCLNSISNYLGERLWALRVLTEQTSLPGNQQQGTPEQSILLELGGGWGGGILDVFLRQKHNRSLLEK